MKIVAIMVVSLLAWPALAHDIYSGVHGKQGQLCCGGTDCASTIYRERGAAYEFLTREKNWVAIPQDHIIFLPIPGDSDEDGDTHRAHLCYQAWTGGPPGDPNVFGSPPIYVWCAFIPPGSI